ARTVGPGGMGGGRGCYNGLMGLRPWERGASVTNQRVRRFHMTLDKSHLLGILHYDSFRAHRVSRLTHSTSHTCYMLIDCAMTHLSHMMLRECMSHSCDS